VHAFVELVDGSVLAQLGFPNMELPILYALTHPERVADSGPRRFDALAAGALTFEPVVPARFPAYALGRAAGVAGGTSPATFNAANETAVELFLTGAVRFGRIAEIIECVLAGAEQHPATSLDAVLEADRSARRRAREVAC
jgi:1-deoxy-D-xylulose-5-phosphate reductoisomerase